MTEVLDQSSNSIGTLRESRVGLLSMLPVVRSGASVVALAVLLACSVAHAQADEPAAAPVDAVAAPLDSSSPVDPPSPAAPIDSDNATLAPLSGLPFNAVQSACKTDSGNAPREYHDCIAAFAKAPEFDRFVKLTDRDQNMIVDQCGGWSGASLSCLKDAINDAAGIPKPPPPPDPVIVAPPDPPPPPKSWNDRLGDLYAAVWHGFWSFCGRWDNFIYSGLTLLFLAWMLKPKSEPSSPLAALTPYIEPDPYFSGAAMGDFTERKDFGDGDWSTAQGLHDRLKGAYSHGEPPVFED